MKLTSLLCFFTLTVMHIVRAGDPTVQVINELQNAVTAKAFDVSVYGTYAPKLVGNGRYGAGIMFTHPIMDYGFAGLRFDVLGGVYTSGTFGGGLKTSLTLAGFKVTPYAGTGIKSVLRGDESVGSVSASVYTGANIQLYTNKAGTVELGFKGEIEYDTAHSGVQIFHGGPYGAIKF